MDWREEGGMQEPRRGHYRITEAPGHCLQMPFGLAQESLAQLAADCSKVFSTVERFEIIRNLQNVFKHTGNGHKKTLVKYNQLLAADQLSS